jgi:hypothetical protein
MPHYRSSRSIETKQYGKTSEAAWLLLAWATLVDAPVPADASVDGAEGSLHNELFSNAPSLIDMSNSPRSRPQLAKVNSCPFLKLGCRQFFLVHYTNYIVPRWFNECNWLSQSDAVAIEVKSLDGPTVIPRARFVSRTSWQARLEDGSALAGCSLSSRACLQGLSDSWRGGCCSHWAKHPSLESRHTPMVFRCRRFAVRTCEREPGRPDGQRPS